jgi:hypothetical protein
MECNGVWLESLKVFGVHPRHEILNDLLIDIRTKRGHGLDDRLV